MRLDNRFQFILPIAVLFFGAFWAGWIARSATNIDSTDRWAWNDAVGWIDFYINDTVQVTGEKIEGYASSSAGAIALDCATSPAGNICGTSQFQVCNGDTSGYTTCSSAADGELSGFAWNDEIGWISFSCADLDVCGVSDYQVTVDSSGNFNDYAWNDLVGWISFNCADPALCGTSDYKVNTAWRAGYVTGQVESIAFDMENQGIINNIVWQGTQPSGTCVKFQIAVADAADGPWNFYGPGQSTTQYFGNSCPGPNTPIKISGTDRSWVNNHRYLRYKTFLQSNTLQDASPVIDSIILNWSP